MDGLTRSEDRVRKDKAAQMNTTSQNVFNLQRRVAGILPVGVDVPHAGKSYRFVRPLVLDEETRLRSSTNRSHNGSPLPQASRPERWVPQLAEKLLLWV
jgi:hypothetical protein